MSTQRRHRSLLRVASLVFTVCLAGLAVAERADAFVYWTNSSGSSIGRAKLDGSNAIRNFVTPISFPEDVAVGPGYIYWTNAADAVGRAKENGTGIDEAFINGSGDTNGVAVDANHIYWSNSADGTIGRANVDGTGVDQSFIEGASEPHRIAVDANHIYWANLGTKAIGRARLDGSDVEQSFISTLGFPGGVAVDAEHIYWVNANITPEFQGAIGRAKLNGSNIEQVFTTSAMSPGFGFLAGVAVDAEHLYWADFSIASVVRSNIDGTGVNVNFITGASFPVGVAVDARPLPPDPPPETTITKRPPNKTRKRNVKFRFVASEPASTFECSFDLGPFTPCTSPHKLKHLSKGKHVFKVRAIDAAGNVDPSPARDRFRVVR